MADKPKPSSPLRHTYWAGWSNTALAWRLASFAIVFAIWEIASLTGFSIAFPRASEVALALWQMLIAGEITTAYADSLPPLLIGLAITIVGGVIVGTTVGLFRGAEWLIMPLLVIFQTAPVSAIIPMLTYVYGISDTSKVVAIVILGLPLVALNSYKGIQATNASLLEMSRSFGMSRANTIRLVILPSARKMVFAGLRLGVSGAFIGIVLAELLITPTGIGDLITFNRSIARYDKMFAAIVSILVLAAVTLSAMKMVEDRLFSGETKK
jgi:ABC-type nitrate/sulfonate/bicarbonate transport system permease component